MADSSRGLRALSKILEKRSNSCFSDAEFAATIGLAMLQTDGIDRFCRSLEEGYSTISTFSAYLSLSSEVEEEARNIFKVIWELKLTKRMPQQAVIGACIFKACRAKKEPKSLKEIAEIGNIARKDLNKCFCLVSKHYKDPEPHDQEDIIINYALKIVKTMNLEPFLEEVVETTVKKATEMGLTTGRHQMIVAASIIYLISAATSNCKIPLKHIATASGISRQSLKGYLTILLKAKFALLSDVCSASMIRRVNDLN